jgi:hypothetical protein
MNPTNNYNITWDTTATYKNLMSESVTNLRYRDDLQLMTSNVYNGTGGSLAYVQNSLHPFGNDGTTAVHGNISTSSTSLHDLLLRGDFNQDGSVNGADVLQMINALANLSSYESTHTISGHSFTNADMLAVADINRDGVINNADLQSLLGLLSDPASGSAAVPRATVEADLATGSDHLPLVADYTVTVGSGSLSSVPEPSSLALLVAGGSLLLWWRRTRTSLAA